MDFWKKSRNVVKKKVKNGRKCGLVAARGDIRVWMGFRCPWCPPGLPRGPWGPPGGPRGTPRNTGNPSRPIYPHAQPPNHTSGHFSLFFDNIFGQFSKFPKLKITNYRSRNIACLGIPEHPHHIRLEKLMRLVRISAQTVQRRPQPRQIHPKKGSGEHFSTLHFFQF